LAAATIKLKWATFRRASSSIAFSSKNRPNHWPRYDGSGPKLDKLNGATPPANSALVSAGAELRMTANWSMLAKFDGEFANGSQTYGGTGSLRYTW
jgi:hypothetical protein